MNANCKPHYKDAGVPLPEDIVTSMTVTLRKIRNAAKNNVKDDTRNADLRKKNNDPDQHLDEAERVAFKKDRASIDKSNDKATDWLKRYADLKPILDNANQARIKNKQVLDDRSDATKKAINDFKRTVQGHMLRRVADTVHGQYLFLTIDAGAFIVIIIKKTMLKLDIR